MSKIRFLFILALLISQYSFAQNDENGCSKLKSFENQHKQESARLTTSEQFDDFDLTYVKFDLKIDNLTTYIEGNVSLKARAMKTDFSTMLLELAHPLNVDSIFYSGIKQNDYTHSNGLLTIELSSVVGEGAFFTVQIYYHGNPPSGEFFSGISQETSNTWGNKVTWTLSEPLNARQWWPSKQVLGDKIDSTDMFVTVPNHLKVGSNGLLTNVTAVDSEYDRYEWKSRYPIAYYLISFAVAEYDEYNVYAFKGTEDELLVQNYLYNNPGVLPAYKSVIDQVPSMIELFSDLFGMYPFKDEKYGHTMAELGGGAMEHQTMSTMTGFPFNTTAHELAHQWFGDQVTCGTWQDIWVNEGFASYSEYIANEFLNSPSAARNWLADAHNYAFERPTGSIYIPVASAEDVYTIFNYRLTYKKGGSIIHMIRRELDDDKLFFNILKAYQNQYRDGVAIGLDFKAVVEQKSGKDFTNFFNQWYFGEGFPIQNFKWTYQNDSLVISSSQTTTSSNTPLFNISIDVKASYTGGDTIIRMPITENEQIFKVKLPEEITSIVVDPENDLLMKIGDVVYVQQIDSDNVLAINEQLSNQIEVYPNPSNGSVNLKFSQELIIQNVRVFNSNGVEIFSTDYKMDGRSDLAISGLESGMYIVHIKTKQQKILKKVIIK